MYSTAIAGPALSASEWMDRIRNGDEAAFESLFRTYAPGLCAYVVRYVNSREMAEDLVQDLFLRIWRQRPEIQITGNMSTYLFAAAKHRALNQIRQERVANRFTAALAARAEDPRDSGETELLELLEIHEAIGRLPARRRLIFTLSRQQGMTNASIAQSLGLSIKTVEAQIGLARKALRAAVE